MSTAHPFPDLFSIDSMLTNDQKQVREAVRNFVQKEMEPRVQKAWRTETFPVELIPKIAALGLLGGDLDAISYGLAMKELERCDSGFRSFASVQSSLVMYPIKTFGSEKQKNEWLPQLGNGTAIGCFGLTESDGGSDPSAMRTRAEKKNGKWILNGSKTWITNGNLAAVAVVWAKTDDGIRGFLVPTNSKGFMAKKMEGKISLRASVTSELYFDNVELSEDSILPKSEGIKSALQCLNQARYGISWGVLGAAEACYDEAVNFAKSRILFGKALVHKQLVQRKLAIMLSKITQGQLLALRLGQLKNEGKLQHYHVSLAKQSNVEASLEIARMARDILGANGIMDEYKSMRHMCNLETVYTYEGTNDIHLLVLGKEITDVAAF